MAIQAILTTHFVFNLREVSLTSNNTSHPQQSRGRNLPGFSQIDFARSIFGNLGAPLTGTREDTYGDDDDNLQEQHLEGTQALERRFNDTAAEGDSRAVSSSSQEQAQQPTGAEGGEGYVSRDGTELLVSDIRYA